MTPDLQSQPGNDPQQRYEKHGANTSAKQEHRHLNTTQEPGRRIFGLLKKELLTQVPEHIEEHGYIEDKELLENIVLWKFPVVIGNIRENTPAQIATVSEHAFQAESARKAIQKLNELQGVADSIAGAILMFAHPHRYTVMDPRATMALETLGYWTGDTAAVDEQYESYLSSLSRTQPANWTPAARRRSGAVHSRRRTEQWLSQSVTSTPTKTSSSSKGDFIMGRQVRPTIGSR